MYLYIYQENSFRLFSNLTYMIVLKNKILNTFKLSLMWNGKVTHTNALTI